MAIITINELKCDPGTTMVFNSGDTYIIQNFTAGDFSGTSGNLVVFQSGTPGSPAYITLPSNITVTYWNCTDCVFSGGIVDATNSTNVNGGGNSGVQWTISSGTGEVITISLKIHSGISIYVGF